MKPEWNKLWKRWEVLDSSGSCEGMRGLEDHDLQVMADEVVRSKGCEPGLHEDWVDEIVAKLRKKYKMPVPTPSWIKAAAKEIMGAQQAYCGSSLGQFGRPSIEKIIRKHAPKT
jgi:hypothetical protein